MPAGTQLIEAIMGTLARRLRAMDERIVQATRPATELASGVQPEAAGVVHAGRCDELVTIAYQPFVEALRWQIEQLGTADLGAYPEELVGPARVVSCRTSSLRTSSAVANKRRTCPPSPMAITRAARLTAVPK